MRGLHKLAEGHGAHDRQGDQQQPRIPPAARGRARRHAGQHRRVLLEQLVLQRAGNMQNEQRVEPIGQQAMPGLADRVRHRLGGRREPVDAGNVGPGDRPEQHGRDLCLARRDHQPAGQRHADHDHVEAPVDDLGQHALPPRQACGLRRRRIGQPPAQTDDAQHQDRNADRLVQLGEGEAFRGLGAHPPGKAHLRHDGQRDQPVQDDRNRGVAALAAKAWSGAGIGHQGDSC